MSSDYYKITLKSDSDTFVSFTEDLHKSGLLEKYGFFQLGSPVHEFREDFMDYIARNGFSSLYNFTICMEDITSPSTSVNDIEKVVEKFILSLNGVKRLVIIDPYFYSKSNTIDTPTVFHKLVSGISSKLEEVTFITNGKKNEMKADIHAAIHSISAIVKIKDFVTDEFHDRFWIDPDNGVGVVMGTSLSGLGNKIALVDKLRGEDVNEVVSACQKFKPSYLKKRKPVTDWTFLFLLLNRHHPFSNWLPIDNLEIFNASKTP